VQILLLGASFDTGNLGVNALAESSVKCILHRWPGAQIILFGSGYEPGQVTTWVADRQVTLQQVPVRMGTQLRLPYHFLWFFLRGAAAKALPGRLRTRMLNGNPYCRALAGASLAVDITGGDSFSDIYGLRRLVIGCLRKWLVLLYGKRLVMLPQTYGPFKGRIARGLARSILRRAQVVYSRDQGGLEYARQVLGPRAAHKAKFSPDVAFVLDPRVPADQGIVPTSDMRTQGSIIVGLNVSGLLHSGGYTRDNMFGLEADYPGLVRRIAELLLDKQGVVLLLVPHVFPEGDMECESDPNACRQVFDMLAPKHPGRVFLANGHYDQAQVKHVIGLCDFFLGSRMHACIGAMSQGIPAVGLAYSKKFAGVFDSVGVGECAVDLRSSDEAAVCAAVDAIWSRRQVIREHLVSTMPQVRNTVLNVFQGIEAMPQWDGRTVGR